MALNLLSTALGGYTSAMLLWAVSRYTTWLDDLEKDSRLDKFFVMLAGIMLANTLVFVVVAKRYKYKVVKHRAPMPRIGPAIANRNSMSGAIRISVGLFPSGS